jgi:hypothetical protein
MVAIGVHENHPHPLFLLLIATGLPTMRFRIVLAGAAVVYILSMLALSGMGRFHGARYLWLQPSAEAISGLRMGSGVDLTLGLALLHIAVFAGALVWAHGETSRLQTASPPEDA